MQLLVVFPTIIHLYKVTSYLKFKRKSTFSVSCQEDWAMAHAVIFRLLTSWKQPVSIPGQYVWYSCWMITVVTGLSLSILVFVSQYQHTNTRCSCSVLLCKKLCWYVFRGRRYEVENVLWSSYLKGIRKHICWLFCIVSTVMNFRVP